MFPPRSSRPSARHLRTVAICALIATAAGAQQANAGPVAKVVNGKNGVQVDNGWVAYQGPQGDTTVNFYDTDGDGSLKLRTNGFGLGGAGLFFNLGGLVFAPCQVGANQCTTSSTTGVSGIGLGFGQGTFGGPGGAAGGWVSDTSVKVHMTNTVQAPGSINAAAVDATNGAYAVGWDASSGSNHAVVLKLDTHGNGKTYAPVSQTDLGTLGGATSQALAISKNAQYIAGTADIAGNKAHAVFALTTATSWTDITSGLPAGVIKSQAVSVSSTGYVAGTASVKRLVSGVTKTVTIGFVYNSNTSTTTVFEAPGFDVQPLKVLPDGRVVGNLIAVASGAIKATHPFLFDGSVVTDYGTMTINGSPAFGCRVNRPNNLGEMGGSCIANGTTPYGIGGTAFYLNIASGTFLDVNAAIHANSDASTPGLAPYHMGSISSMDDLSELSLLGVKFVNGNANMATFLSLKTGYNP